MACVTDRLAMAMACHFHDSMQSILMVIYGSAPSMVTAQTL